MSVPTAISISSRKISRVLACGEGGGGRSLWAAGRRRDEDNAGLAAPRCTMRTTSISLRYKLLSPLNIDEHDHGKVRPWMAKHDSFCDLLQRTWDFWTITAVFLVAKVPDKGENTSLKGHKEPHAPFPSQPSRESSKILIFPCSQTEEL